MVQRLLFVGLGLFVLACGARTADSDESAGAMDAGVEASTAGPGLVWCGDGPCDVASGNQCYLCDKQGPYRCHTLDLPPACDAPVQFRCDGPEDCVLGEQCVEACEPGVCSAPGRVCR
jgi:hypothetical protein